MPVIPKSFKQYMLVKMNYIDPNMTPGTDTNISEWAKGVNGKQHVEKRCSIFSDVDPDHEPSKLQHIARMASDVQKPLPVPIQRPQQETGSDELCSNSVSTFVSVAESTLHVTAIYGMPPTPVLQGNTTQIYDKSFPMRAAAPKADSSEAFPMRAGTTKAVRAPRHFFSSDQAYHEVKHLGSGGNGQVSLFQGQTSDRVFAVKSIHHGTSEEAPIEMQALEFLGPHPNIVRFHEAFFHSNDHTDVLLVFEYCDGGDLEQWIMTHAMSAPEAEIWRALLQITEAIAFMHERGMVHGDIKPQNVLVQSQWYGPPNFKLADFGTAVVKPNPRKPRGIWGTWLYAPIESVYHFGPETDIWCLGIIVQYLGISDDRSIRKEFNKLNTLNFRDWIDRNILDKVQGVSVDEEQLLADFVCFQANHEYSLQPIKRPIGKYSKLLNHFMMRCLEVHHEKRITAAELLKFVKTLEPVVRDAIETGDEAALDLVDDVKEAFDDTVVLNFLLEVQKRAGGRKTRRG